MQFVPLIGWPARPFRSLTPDAISVLSLVADKRMNTRTQFSSQCQMNTITEDRAFSDREILLGKLEKVINQTVIAVCSDHYKAYTEEPPLTTRIAQAIENKLRQHPLAIGGFRLEVATQNAPDRTNATRRIIGADLYISVIRRDLDSSVSAGILVQSNLDRSLTRDKKRFRNQATRMQGRSTESWILEPADLSVFPAKRACYPILPRDFLKHRLAVGSLIADGLRSYRGDQKIGRCLDLPSPESIDRILHKLKARTALCFTLVGDTGVSEVA